MKRVAAMALAEKQNEGLIFENLTGATVNDILLDDEANEAFDKIDGNITGVDWETKTEIQYLAGHMLQLNNNQYAALAGKEDSEGNKTRVQEWTTTAKSQECDTTAKSQEWIATTGARNQEAWEQLTKRTNWQSLRRTLQKQNGISRKRLIY